MEQHVDYKKLVSFVDLVLECKQKESKLFQSFIDHFVGMKDGYQSTYNTLRKNLPYVINILDEIHANENAHSRILVRLLQFKNNDGVYCYLKSFLEYLGDAFVQLEIVEPDITAEINRIDAGIRDKNWCIIVENKIHGAVDQEEQIVRYINSEKKRYPENKIYVVYISNDGGSPSENSFPKKEKDKFENRYKEISYKNNILPWLISLDETLGVVNISNESKVNLDSAIKQYINHLQGKFDLRNEQETEMTNEIINYLKDQIKIKDSLPAKEKIEKMLEFINYSNEIVDYLSNDIENIISNYLKLFSSKISTENIKNIDNIRSVGVFGEKDSTIYFHPKSWKPKFSIGLCFEKRLSFLYYGVFDEEENSEKKLWDQFKVIFPKTEVQTKGVPFSVYLTREIDHLNLLNTINTDQFLEYFKTIINDIITQTNGIKEIIQ
jgi:hypothetical protein